MIAVGIETSSREGSLALVAANATLHATLGSAARHASDLLPRLESLLESAGLRRSGPLALDLVCAGRGPGSYTGLRVGLATALGLARASGAVFIGVPSFDALAYAELAPGERCTVLRDARAGRLYFATYERLETDVRALVAPCALEPDDALARLMPETPLLADAACAELVGSRAVNVHVDAQPQAGALLALALERHRRGAPGMSGQDEIEPLYLRPSESWIRSG